MRVCLLSAFTPNLSNYGWYIIANRLKYASRHQYTSKVFQSGFLSDRHPSFSKIHFIQEMLPNYDWVFWLDADALIMNLDISLDSFLSTDSDIIISRDINGVNCGSFLIRNTKDNFKFLQNVSTCKEHYHHAPWEQIPFIRYLADVNVGYVPQRKLNAYSYTLYNRQFAEGEYNVGDFVLHFAGLTNEKRYHLIRTLYYSDHESGSNSEKSFPSAR